MSDTVCSQACLSDASQCQQSAVLISECFLQNPVNSLQWMEADLHLLGPMTSLILDTKNFCQPVLRAKLFLTLAIFVGLFANLALLVRTSHTTNLFSLFDFIESFRLELVGMMSAECVVYFLLVNGMRRLLSVSERRRLHPAAA